MNNILIVEDETKLADVVRDYLQSSGFGVQVLNEGTHVAASVREAPPALVILDVMLPGKDGLTILGEIRSFSAVPIIMATARVEEIDRLLGLELGADDYLCKPYSPRELVARVKAVLRRADANSGSLSNVSVGNNEASGENDSPVALDEARLRITSGARDASLTAVEFALLKTLHKSPGRIYNRNALMDAIYDDHRVVSDRTIDSHIKRVRRKFRTLDKEFHEIETLYGIGYRYRES